MALADKRLTLWHVHVDKGTPTKVTTDLYYTFGGSLSSAWSPDSKWLTYSRYLPNHIHAIFVYSLENAKKSRVTDGMSDARYPVFYKGGKYLFFAASTDEGLGVSWLNLSGFQRPVSRSVYAVVLKKTDPNPIEPPSAHEKRVGQKHDKTQQDEKNQPD